MRRQVAAALVAFGRGVAVQQQLGKESAALAGLTGLRRGFADDASLKKTVLYDFHVAQGGRFAS
jgi:aminomethyltransferase